MSRYGAIVIDPPVRFETWSDKGDSRTAAAHYDLMSWNDLSALGPLLERVTLPDACLFLWICPPLIPETLRLAESWGWKYKTVAFTWVKTQKDDQFNFRLGMGYWTRANAEQVWLLTRGKPQRRCKSVLQALHTVDTPAVVAPWRAHSAKPEEVQNRIERLVDGPYLELFARRRRPGWTCIGNELDGLDIRDSLRYVAEDRPLPTAAQTLLELAL